MHVETNPAGLELAEKLLVITRHEGEREHSELAVSHFIGSNIVTIRGSFPNTGPINIETDESLLFLRDALAELCRIKDIGNKEDEEVV